MKAIARERSRPGKRTEVRTVYAEALRSLADTLDGSADLEFKVDRQDRVRVSLVIPAELRARVDGHCERLKLLGAEYAIAALTRYLDGAGEGTDDSVSQSAGARPAAHPT